MSMSYGQVNATCKSIKRAEDARALLEEESMGQRRKSVMLRLYKRYSALRFQEEMEALSMGRVEAVR